MEKQQGVRIDSLPVDDRRLYDAEEADILALHREKIQAEMGQRAIKTLLRSGGSESRQPESIAETNTESAPAAPQFEKLSLSDFFSPEDFLDDSTEAAPEEDVKTEKSERELRAREAMLELMQKNVAESAEEYHRLNRDILSNKLMLRIAIQQSREADASKVSTRSKVTDGIRERIDACGKRLESLPKESPESHVVVHGYELRKHIAEIQNGEIVTTPYVRRHLDRVEANMAEGRPTFIHGHLGSGKTELAIAAAKHTAIDKMAYEAATRGFQEFRANNPDATKDECRDELRRLYSVETRHIQRALRAGDSEITEKVSPLIISGSKDLTTQDLYTDKTLKLKKFNGKSLLEHKDDLDAEIEQWKAEHPEEAADPEKLSEEASKILELYKLKNQAFGTEVDTILKPIAQAVKEGRPVILDEVNAVPMAVLISMNDILQRRPGDTCYVPGLGATKIADGFSITMTGNLSSGTVNYVGTDTLNPAFLSRLDILEHDYLPMAENDTNYDQQADPSQNELFQVMTAYLADRNGNLELPEKDKTLKKLFRLAQLSHQTQLIFEGKWRESQSITTDSGDELEPSLEQSVLSIRNILNVLKDWDKGSERDLDTALWDGFISSIANPDEQNQIIALAMQYGFFSKDDGWRTTVKERGSGFTTLDEAHPGEFNFERKPLELCDLRETVDILYGKAPNREIYPDINLDELQEEFEEVSLEDIEAYEHTIEELGTAIKALEVLYTQCGCEVPQEG